MVGGRWCRRQQSLAWSAVGLGTRFNQRHVLTLVTFVVVVVMVEVDDDEADTESAPGVLGS